jgi:hypothetical protein
MKNQLSFRWNRGHRNLMNVVFLFLFAVLSIFTTACDKNAPVAVDKQADLEQKKEQQEVLSKDVKVQVLNLETAQYSYQGKLFKREELERVIGKNQSPFLVAGLGQPEENVVYVFDSQNEFDSWAKSTGLTDKLSQLNKQTGGTGDKGILSHGWARLWDHYYWSNGIPYGYGDNRFFSVPSSASTLGTFNNEATLVNIYSSTYVTYCDIYQNSYFNRYAPGWVYRLFNPYANWTRKVILGWPYNNATSSVYVHY